MLNLIEQELEKENNSSITENGAKGYKTTKSALVDINFKVSSLRNSDENEIIELFDKAYNENQEYALKWLFFARDIREGLGERRLFRICYRRLAELNIDLFYKNLYNISEYGRWDDLIALLNINNQVDKKIAQIIARQLDQDGYRIKLNEPISLLAKWMPSENASSIQTKKLAKKLRRLLNLSSREYRLLLSQYRAYINVVEQKMCNNDWDKIDYEKVPSLANLRYRNAFLKHDYERRREYIESLTQGAAKMNMQVATPIDIVSRYKSWHIKPLDETLELAWKNLKDISIQDTLVVADGSGSMTIHVGWSKTTALDVANALAIFTSEHNDDVYKNKYITFSHQPQFVCFEEKQTLHEKLCICREHNEVSNTNIEAVFDLILKTAITNNVEKDKMIKNILIISDMEFDSAQSSSWFAREKANPLTLPLFEDIKQRYYDAGYQLPKLIFWNVCSRTQTIPLTENELGVVLVSGFSQNALKMVMSNKYNPYDVLVETITNKRYNNIVCE